MALNFVKVPPGSQRLGNTRKDPIDLTLDNSYAGGFDMTEVMGKLGVRRDPSHLIGIETIGGNAYSHGFDFRWNPDTGLMQVYRKGSQPAMIIEEAVVVASNVGTLKRIPGYILTAQATAGSVTGTLRIIPVGETPATKQVAVNFLTGGLTFFSTDAVTAVKISYIPLGVGPFVEANRIIDESNTGTNDTTRQTANRVGLLQYFWNDTSSVLPIMIPVGESPSTGEVAFDINNSGDSIFTVNAAQDDATYKITYWKHSAFVDYGWTDQADITVTSDVVLFTEELDLGGIWIPGFGNVIVGEATTTNKQAILEGPSGAAAANIGVLDPAKNSLTLASADSYTTIEMPYIVLDALTVSDGEVAAGEDLSLVTVRLELTTY